MRIKGSPQLLVAATLCVVCIAAGFGAGRLFAPHQAANRAHEALSEHGIWTLSVYNPGGQLVSSRTFHNDLLTGLGNGGDVALADLLTRTYPMGPWQVVVADSNTNFLFQLSSAADIGLQGPGVFPLTVSSGSQGHVDLSGQWTATSAVTIGRVSTSVSLCTNNTIAPHDCVNYFGDYIFAFSATTLAVANQLPVANGQIVQVHVDISFT